MNEIDENITASEPTSDSAEEVAPNDENDSHEAESIVNDTPDTIDYSELLAADMKEISEEFSASEAMEITDLKNPIRYGALRDLGLSPKEAYLASGGRKERADNRAHLSSSVPKKMATSFSEIPKSDFDAARELFSDMSDSEIRNLYKKVTQ